MRLLVVVDKLLTGFDAPSCTYLYIDKSMQDHGLFQAICRTNRLDGDDKPFGYIVDYKDLFRKVQGALAVYASELDTSDGGPSPEVLLQDRLKAGRQRLEDAREALRLLCEPVQPPGGELEHIRYFCGNSEIAEDLASHEPQRVALYKTVAALLRAYASLSDSLREAGYSAAEADAIEREVERAVALRETIRRASGETLDPKTYEADMRHLIDAYIRADEARRISDFGEIGLLDLVVKSGLAAAIASLPASVRANKDAVAETIANNVRSRIIREHLHDPVFYDQMSKLLAEVLADLRARRVDYEEFLKRMAQIAVQVQSGHAADTPEPLARSQALRAVYNTLASTLVPATGTAEPRPAFGAAPPDPMLDLAQSLDAQLRTGAPDGWRGVLAKERAVKGLIFGVVKDQALVELLFPVIKAQAEY